MLNKVWFITGASRGFGRVWAEAALKRGDYVVATARTLTDVADISAQYGKAVLPLALDVTDADRVEGVVKEAHAHFGRLDIIINNAGYALVGAVEEASEADVRHEFETNFFGARRVIQAVLPLLRQQGGGHILAVSSVAGVVAGPIVGYYNASKWALEALHESLAQEVRQFGIKVTLLEPGAYATGFASQTSLRLAQRTDTYAPLWAEVLTAGARVDFGDPQATGAAILKLVDADNPPLRFFVGTEGLPLVRTAYAERLATWEAWEAVSTEAQGKSTRQTVTL